MPASSSCVNGASSDGRQQAKVTPRRAISSDRRRRALTVIGARRAAGASSRHAARQGAGCQVRRRLRRVPTWDKKGAAEGVMHQGRLWLVAILACAGAAALALPAAGARGTARVTDDEIVARLREYLRVDTSNPPGNEMKAAIFFRDWFKTEGIDSTVFEFQPGRAVLV